MKLTTIKAAVASLVLSAVSYAVPNAGWDLTNSFDVNTLTGTIVAGNTPGTFDYKFDVDGSEENGDLAGSLETEISDDGKTAWVTWSPLGSLSFEKIYQKSGPQYEVFDVSGVDWSLYSGFYVTNTTLINGNNLSNISHIQLDGGVSTSVPDSANTSLLLVTGLALVAAARRFGKSA